MSARNFIKDNFVLILGLALPLLLVGFFMLASALPRSFSPPPAHDIIFTAQEYRHGAPQDFYNDFFVKDQRLHMRLTPVSPPQNGGYKNRLFIYTPSQNALREISPALPDGLATDAKSAFIVAETQNLPVDTAPQAPDGYTFDAGQYRSSGLVMDIFGGASGRHGPYLKKNSATFKINPPQNMYPGIYNLQFVGWVTTTEGSKP